MSRLSITPWENSQRTVDDLYADMERRISAAPCGNCPVELTSAFLKLCLAQSCGKCVPCRIGLDRLSAMLDRLLDGNGSEEDMQTILRSAQSIVDSADCAIGFEAAQMVLDGYVAFHDDYLAHIEQGSCTANFKSVPCVELCPQEMFHRETFQRVTFIREGKLSWEAIAERISEQKQALCIVNSRKSAQKIYGLLDPEGAFHLSTLMYPAHRKSVLTEIRARLKLGLPCRVVSTSLIEAGVDVDFPAVFREEAGLDSILQAAGRCNREGKRSAIESIVTIFQSETPPPSLFEIPVAAGRQALNQYDQPDSPEAIRCYFQELLDLKGPEALDQKNILTLMERDYMPFRKIAERFHLIDSETRTVYIPLEEGEELVQRLRSGEHNRALFRALGQYGVSIYPQHFEALDLAGDLEILESGAAVLTNLTLYDSTMGLSPTADSGKALFI